MNKAPLSESLFAFVRTAELGSFAAAAAALGVTPAAVGQTVKRLEDQFGVKLINRTTRKMSLTPEGWLSDRVRDFVDDPVDLAFRQSRPDDSSLIARPISTLQAVTVAAPDYLERCGEPGHPQDLARHACIGYRYPTTGAMYPWSFLINGEEHRTSPDCAIIVNDPETACEAAALGLGVVQTGSNYAAPYLAAGRLRVVMAPFIAATHTLYLCYPSRDHIPLRVRAFIDHALGALGRDRFMLSFA